MLYDFYKNRLKNRVFRAMFIALMNIIVIFLVSAWTLAGILLFPLGLPLMRFLWGYSSKTVARKCIWIYGRVWQFLLKPFVDFKNPDIDKAFFSVPGVIVTNHRSFFDTYCMNMMPVSDVCFAVRGWPFKIPIYNIFMKLAGYLNIESFSWQKTARNAKVVLDNEGFILFFPEGHRSRNKDLLHFYSGAFKLAIANNAPIIPICLVGTQDLMPPGRRFLKPARITMKVLEPVFPDQFSGKMGYVALKKHVRSLMSAHLSGMDEPGI